MCTMIFREKPSVMPLLHHYECHWRKVALLQAGTRLSTNTKIRKDDRSSKTQLGEYIKREYYFKEKHLSNSIHFIKQDLAKLPLTDTISASQENK